MKITTEKPTKITRQRSSKYQLIFNEIPNITKDKALVIECDEESPAILESSMRMHLWRNGITKKYSILLRKNKVFIQLKRSSAAQ